MMRLIDLIVKKTFVLVQDDFTYAFKNLDGARPICLRI